MTGIILTTIFAIWFNIAYNKLNKLKVEVEDAYALMDMNLEKRYNLVPNIVNIVNGAGIGAEELTEKVMIVRDATWDPGSWAGKVRTETELGELINELIAFAEADEKVKNTNSFVKFKEQILAINEAIEESTAEYNEVVTAFNKRRSSFPAVMYTKMSKLEKRAYFAPNKK